MKLFLFTLLTVTFFSLTACEKDQESDDNSNTPTTPFTPPTGEAAKIMGKWGVGSITLNKQFGATSDQQIFTATTADYIDFRSDGKMHTYFNGQLDISEYRVKNAQSITIDEDPATVTILTDTRLVITSRDETGTFGYTEIVYDLKK